MNATETPAAPGATPTAEQAAKIADDMAAFVRARLDEYHGQPSRLDFTSLPQLAACWRRHPDYKAEWAP